MTIHRFFVPSSSIVGEKVALSKETSHQIIKVLRLEPKDEIIILDNTGLEYQVKIDQTNSGVVEGTILETRENEAEPSLKISLYQALLPREKFEFVLQKGTEVGVNQFIPVQTVHSLPSKDLSANKLERWQAITKEAAEQSQRGIIPKVEAALNFKEAINQATQNGAVLIAWEKEDHNLPQILNTKYNIPSVFVGPEGGFTEEEIEYAKSKGAETIGLGKRILRSETAGITIPALLIYSL